ncbi:MAG: NUDIX domain-containing protein [Bacilli bacterium]|nr:NUDIX domain-containing protein [Bacilli bacterium]
MTEMLHCCDENLKTIEAVDRDIVHKEGIWHKTAHVWLYDDEGFVYFQVRADADKLYTSASGHVMAGEEPINTAYRETAEELGFQLDPRKLELIEVDAWKLDTEVKHDHAFAYIYLYKIPRNYDAFSVNPDEVSDIVKIKARDLLGYLLALPFECEQYNVHNKKLKHNKDLLLMEGEISILKYGRILNAITKKVQ